MSFNPDKTEIMIFSINHSIPENLDFSVNGKSVPITTSHKHLGITFSNDAKWNTHVDNIQISVSKHLNILCKLKYRLSRTNLDKLYFVYIRPLFDYACELWDNCGIGNSQNWNNFNWNLPELLQAYIFSQKLKFYIHCIEIGWKILSVRWRRRKLQLFFMIYISLISLIIFVHSFPHLQSTSEYPLRNGNDIILPFCRMCSTSDSFIASTVKMWDNLNNTIRNVDTLYYIIKK